MVYPERRPQQVIFQYPDIWIETIYQLKDPSLDRLEEVLADIKREISQFWRKTLQSVEIHIYIYDYIIQILLIEWMIG